MAKAVPAKAVPAKAARAAAVLAHAVLARSWPSKAALAAALLTTLALPALAFEMSDLMSQLSQRRSGEARFTEQRFVSGLEQSLHSSGTLSFTAPDRLARHTLRPRAESFMVEGNRLVLERGGRVRQMSLDAMPEIAAMVAALRGTLSGDGAVLQQHFRPTLSGQAAQWSLTLLPLDERLASIVKLMRLDGQQADLRSVEVQLVDGDRSVMSIEPSGAGKSRPGTP